MPYKKQPIFAEQRGQLTCVSKSSKYYLSVKQLIMLEPLLDPYGLQI